MTEDEWSICTDTRKMLKFLVAPSERKRLLLCSAGCRRLWHLLESSRLRRAVDRLERYADAAIDVASFRAAAFEAHPLRCYRDDLFSGKAGDDRWFAAYAIHKIMFWRNVQTVRDCLDFLARAAAYTPHDSPRRVENPDAPCEIEQAAQADLIRDLFGDRFRPVILPATWLVWNDAVVVRLAQVAYENRILPAGTLDNTRLAVLADALEEAGCTDELILGHLRKGGDHYRGCFAVDALLDKS